MPHDVIMPALGVAQDTGLIVAWLKHSGDAIKTGDALMEIETDKAVVEVEAQADGYLSNVTAAEGEQVPVGQVVALIVESSRLADGKTASPTVLSGSATSVSDLNKPDSGRITDPAVTTGSGITKTETLTESTIFRHSIHTQKLSTSNGEDVPAGRILASPKARRLAIEQGLQLELLVEHGVSQPYHVADLDKLRHFDKEHLPHGATISEQSTLSSLRIDARVPKSTHIDFIHWLATQRDLTIPSHMVWLRYATASLRHATERTKDSLVVEVRQVHSQDERYLDADHARLSRNLTQYVDHHPSSLVLHHLIDSPIISLTTSVQTAPVLTIRLDGDSYAISLDYKATQLNESEATVFITDFAERVAEPLRHLL